MVKLMPSPAVPVVIKMSPWPFCRHAEVLLRLLRHLPHARLAFGEEDPLQRQETSRERQGLLPELDGGAGNLGSFFVRSLQSK